MSLKQKIAAAISGTSAMTLFSYALSAIHRNNFKEPENLSILIHRMPPYPDKNKSRLAGWFAHYAVGLLFAELYAGFWKNTVYKPDIKSGLVLGGISGFAAILIWKFTLAIHPDPPALNFKKYALNLFTAHLIFGVFAAFGFRLMAPKGSHTVH